MERHLQLDAGIQGRGSKISPSMGCRNRGVGAGFREGAWKKSRENEDGRLVEEKEKECWEARGGVGGKRWR